MKWISDTHDCPCLMKTDMEKSGNVYDFLRVYYEEIYGKDTITKLAVEKSIASKRFFNYNPL